MGHVLIGSRLRGAIIFLTIAATFWAGIALGGVMTVDYQNERWWFVANMFTGVHGLSAWYMQDKVYRKLLDRLDGDEDFERLAGRCRTPGELFALRLSCMDKIMHQENVALVAPTETIARAYAGVAGLLNMMCIFDVLVLSIVGPYRRRGEG